MNRKSCHRLDSSPQDGVCRELVPFVVDGFILPTILTSEDIPTDSDSGDGKGLEHKTRVAYLLF